MRVQIHGEDADTALQGGGIFSEPAPTGLIGGACMQPFRAALILPPVLSSWGSVGDTKKASTETSVSTRLFCCSLSGFALFGQIAQKVQRRTSGQGPHVTSLFHTARSGTSRELGHAGSS